VAGQFGIRPLYKMLGYFSLIGLLRLHSLLGDYSMALKVIGNIELNRKVCVDKFYNLIRCSVLCGHPLNALLCLLFSEHVFASSGLSNHNILLCGFCVSDDEKISSKEF
jgi:hypothetical protein